MTSHTIKIEPRFFVPVLIGNIYHICFPYQKGLLIAYPNIESKSKVNSLMKFIRTKSALSNIKESRTHKAMGFNYDMSLYEFEDTYFELIPDSNIEKPFKL